ncbi:filamentous hemagglutinin N-terminal domain-containing protein [Psittacicella gerlachiana]|uniref:Filamentous haemagglutinin FhaB/tRNA nuclease CdiA-like TPS domain-containing protein n=1 Tax=Psittacicella gerlachiana TaxID=2028574 RepID=A0A3A1YNT1_9GAMM|nr:filamentous hemagglutinin N-terminal domain-containing protein [Psittacicella gerlachiana]RIY37944.1 hypothetical protein CKF59_01075 [Psittacicella gerlachiana]
MNKIYKLKFNRQTQQLEAVSELATRATTGSTQSATSLSSKLFKLGKLATLFIPFTAFMSLAHADPARTGMQVVAGQVQTLTEGLVTTITNSPHAIINWEKFNINSNELVKFVQENSNSAVLNRVLGGSVSQILGQLQSNGKVFIVNPAGIVFGANAQVDVAGLVASTLDLINEDFVKGNYVFSQDKEQALASVINQGVIKVAEDGTLALVGGKVVNNGVLEAKNGTVYLLAGQSITIQDLDNPLISYKVTAENKAVNLGEIVAKKAYLAGNKVAHSYTQAQAFADLVSGSSSVSGVKVTATGEVVLYGATAIDGSHSLAVVNAGVQAQKVDVFADVVVAEKATHITASEQVRLGGDYQGKGTVKLAAKTTVQQGATIDVSTTQGDAGTIIVWGNQADVAGNFIATAVEGKGGFVETSGKVISVSGTQVDTRSLYGADGSWLIDPTEVKIVNSTTYASHIASGKQATSNKVGTFGEVYLVTPSTEQQVSYIKDEDLSTKLKSTNISLFAQASAEDKNSKIEFDHANVTGDSRYGLTLVANELKITNSNISKLSYLLFLNSFPGIEAKTVTVSGSHIKEVENLVFCVTSNLSINNASVLEVNRAALVGGNLALDNVNITVTSNGNQDFGDFYAYAINGSNSLTNGTEIITQGKAYLTASADLTINSASVTAKTDVATKGNNVTLTGAKAFVGAGNVSFEANQSVTFTNNANVGAREGYLLVETAQDITVANASQLSAKTNINLRSTAQDVVVHNATVTAGQDLTLDGNRDTLVVGANLIAGKGLAVVTGTRDALVYDSALVSQENLSLVTSNVSKEAIAGDLIIANASLTSKAKNVNLEVNNLALVNTNVSATAGDFNVTTKGIIAIIAQDKLNNFTANNAMLSSRKNIGVNRTEFVVTGNLNFKAERKVGLNQGTKLTTDKLNLQVPQAYVIDTQINANEVNFETNNTLWIQENEFKIGKYFNVRAEIRGDSVNNNYSTTERGEINFNLGEKGELISIHDQFINLSDLKVTADKVTFEQGNTSNLSNLTLETKSDLILSSSSFNVLDNIKVSVGGNLDSIANTYGTEMGEINFRVGGEFVSVDDKFRGGGNFTATAQKLSTLQDHNSEFTIKGTAQIEAEQVDLAHAKLVAGTLELTLGSLNASNSQITTTNGAFTLVANKTVTRATSFDENWKVTAETSIPNHLNFSQAQVQTNSDLKVSGATTLVLEQAQVKAGGGVELQAEQVTANNLKVQAGIPVSGSLVGLTSAEGTVKGSADFTLVANSSLNLTGLEVEANGITIAAKQLTLNLANLNATREVKLEANQALVVTNSNLTTPNASIVGATGLSLEANNITATAKGGDLALSALNGTLVLTKNRFENYQNLTAKAQETLVVTENNLSLDRLLFTLAQAKENSVVFVTNTGVIEYIPRVNGKLLDKATILAENPNLTIREKLDPFVALGIDFSGVRLPDIFADNRRFWLIGNNFDLRRLAFPLGEFAPNAQPLPEIKTLNTTTLESSASE